MATERHHEPNTASWLGDLAGRAWSASGWCTWWSPTWRCRSRSVAVSRPPISGALAEIGATSFGKVALWLLAVGLFAFGLWQF